MINIALFGPPGAGKGTQSSFLIEKYDLFYISTGDLLRKELAEETKLGLEAKSIIAAGKLVSDEIIVQILEKTIKGLPPGFKVVFELRDVQGLSTEDTAEALGLSVPAVKSRLLRARLQLRERLSRYFRRKKGVEK